MTRGAISSLVCFSRKPPPTQTSRIRELATGGCPRTKICLYQSLQCELSPTILLFTDTK